MPALGRGCVGVRSTTTSPRNTWTSTSWQGVTSTPNSVPRSTTLPLGVCTWNPRASARRISAVSCPTGGGRRRPKPTRRGPVLARRFARRSRSGTDDTLGKIQLLTGGEPLAKLIGVPRVGPMGTGLARQLRDGAGGENGCYLSSGGVCGRTLAAVTALLPQEVAGELELQLAETLRAETLPAETLRADRQAEPMAPAAAMTKQYTNKHQQARQRAAAEKHDHPQRSPDPRRTGPPRTGPPATEPRGVPLATSLAVLRARLFMRSLRRGTVDSLAPNAKGRGRSSTESFSTGPSSSGSSSIAASWAALRAAASRWSLGVESRVFQERLANRLVSEQQRLQFLRLRRRNRVVEMGIHKPPRVQRHTAASVHCRDSWESFVCMQWNSRRRMRLRAL